MHASSIGIDQHTGHFLIFPHNDILRMKAFQRVGNLVESTLFWRTWENLLREVL